MKLSQSSTILAVLSVSAVNAASLRRAPAPRKLQDQGVSGTDLVTTVPDSYTATQTQAVVGFQPGAGYTYVMDYQNIAIELMNQMLEPTCAEMNSYNPSASGDSATVSRNLGFSLDPSTSSTVIYDEEFVEAITDNYPTCRQTCVDSSDSFFLKKTGLEDSRDGDVTEYNTKTWGDIVNNDTTGILENVISSFGKYEPASDTVRECIMNYEQFEEGTSLYATAYNANKSTYQFAPGLHIGDNRTCEMQLGSTGAYYNETSDTINSVCHPHSPGIQFNLFATNG
ncbi:MAG: hypothetical protein SGILL_010095, partial [Bacillariaceae sp.]